MDQPPLADVLWQPAVADALRATFGSAQPEAVEPLRGGLSGALLAKLTLGGRRYVLRLVGGRPADVERELLCMNSAAERGLAPRVLYSSAADRVVISEFVDGVTLDIWLRAGGTWIEPLGRLLRQLHEGPAFPRFMRVSDACRMFAGGLAAGAPLRLLLPEVEAAREALAPHLIEAPCHNDLNPGNILVEDGRLWLIDWAGACAGDPFHDVATPGIFLLRAPEPRAQLLEAYLGRPPSPLESARAEVARGLGLVFYALIFAQVAAAVGALPIPAEGPASPIADPRRFAEAIARQAEGELHSPDWRAALTALR